MPNWCSNRLSIWSDNVNILNALIRSVVSDNAIYPSPLSLAKIAPIPKEVVEDDGDLWYYWRLANWGTKWDIEAISPTRLETDDIETEMFNLWKVWRNEQFSAGMCMDFHPDKQFVGVLEFDTAWNPPIPAIKKFSENHPDLEFILQYIELGQGFAGAQMFVDGEIMSTYRYDSPSDVTKAARDWFGVDPDSLPSLVLEDADDSDFEDIDDSSYDTYETVTLEVPKELYDELSAFASYADVEISQFITYAVSCLHGRDPGEVIAKVKQRYNKV